MSGSSPCWTVRRRPRRGGVESVALLTDHELPQVEENARSASTASAMSCCAQDGVA
ncbi:hypothetical protein K7G98_15015 [Saccharothrix sp. MB29]|nr:hypothetical protein [Saccharothrix sp. MB29]